MMTNLNQITLDGLLERVQIIDDMMPSLSQRGLEKAQDELSAIEAELDSRQPGVEFRTLYEMVIDNAPYASLLSLPVGFEPIYGDYSDDYNEWELYGFIA